MNGEIWWGVPGYGGNFEASSFGRVRSKERVVIKKTRYGGVMEQRYGEKILTPSTERGYKFVHIGVAGRKIHVGVHRLVLLAFHGEGQVGQITRHLNGNPADNRPENLAWGDHLQNMADRKLHGRYANGERHCMAKLSNEQARQIKNSSAPGVELARLYGISQTQVSRIRLGRSWQEAI